MKTVSRNKLLRCFRPMVDVDVVINEPRATSTANIDHSTDLGFTYLTAENHVHDMKVSGSDNNGSSMNSEKNSKIVRQPGKRTFSSVLKAVFFETILAKRIRDRKGFRTKERPSLDLGSSTTYEPTISAPENGVVQETNTSSSSSAPEPMISPKTNLCETAKKSHEDHTEKPQSGINSVTGPYLLLISLAMTVLWGTFCALIFTSVLLCFLTLPYAGNHGQESVKKSSLSLSETEFKDHIKKLEEEGRKWKGLLQRKRIVMEKEIRIRRALNF